MSRKEICLACGDNAATENDVVCEMCHNHMLRGGYVGDGL